MKRTTHTLVIASWALRNYSQHRGLPLHGTSIGGTWVSDADENGNIEMRGSLRYTVAGNIDVQTLLKDGKLKRPVAVEIEALGQQTLDVATYVREYIEGLNMVHGRLREALEPHLKRWKAEIRTAIAKYSDGGSNDVLGLEVAHLAEDGAVISRMALMEDLIRRSEELSRRNKTLGNLRKMFVSGELRKHKSRPTRST